MTYAPANGEGGPPVGQQLVVNVLEHPEEAHEEVTSAHWTKKMLKCALCRILGRKREEGEEGRRGGGEERRRGGGEEGRMKGGEREEEEEKEWKNRRRRKRRRRRRKRRTLHYYKRMCYHSSNPSLLVSLSPIPRQCSP